MANTLISPRINDQKIGFILLILIAVSSPWGDVARLGQSTAEGAERGLTTFFGLVFLLTGIISGSVLRGLYKIRTVFFFIIFLFIANMQTTVFMPSQNSTQIFSLLAYLCICITVVGFGFSPKQMLQIVCAFAFSAGLMCLVSVIDQIGIYDVPRFNESSASMSVDDDVSVTSLAGPFFSRTPFATHLSLALPIAFGYLFVEHKNRRDTFLRVAVFATIAVAGAMSYSRNLYLCLPLSMIYLAYHSKNLSLSKIVGAIATISFICIIIFGALSDEYSAMFFQKISTLNPTAIESNQSDMTRRDTLLQTWEDLGQFPLGAGFTRPNTLAHGELNVHSNFTWVLRAGGVLGVVLVTIFLYPVLQRMISRQGVGTNFLIYSALLSYAFYGATHTIISTLFAWILLGLAFDTPLKQKASSHGYNKTINSFWRFSP